MKDVASRSHPTSTSHKHLHSLTVCVCVWPVFLYDFCQKDCSRKCIARLHPKEGEGCLQTTPPALICITPTPLCVIYVNKFDCLMHVCCHRGARDILHRACTAIDCVQAILTHLSITCLIHTCDMTHSHARHDSFRAIGMCSNRTRCHAHRECTDNKGSFLQKSPI